MPKMRSVASLSENEFEHLLEEVYRKIVEYEARFSRDKYEIAVLMPIVTARMFMLHKGLQMCMQYDRFEYSAYLFGHKVVMVNKNFLQDIDGCNELIRLVIGCKERDAFPIYAAAGDYIFHNGDLLHVRKEFYIEGQRALETKVVDFEYTEMIFDNIGLHRINCEKPLWTYIPDKYKPSSPVKDKWVENVDHGQINEYLASLSML